MTHETIISSKSSASNYWKIVWKFRELLLIFAWRDLSVRYKQTFIGIAWSLIRPILSIMIFTFVFGRIARLPSPSNSPYILVVFCAMLPWQLFSTSLTSIAESLTSNSNLISKIYFPRLIIPISAIAAPIVDFAISFILLFFTLIYFSQDISIKFLAIFPLTLLSILMAIGPGLILCTLNVAYRDFRYLLPFIIQIGFYLSPVGFSSSVVPKNWLSLYELNPMVGVIEGFRWALLDIQVFPTRPLIISLVFVILSILTGFYYFRKAENNVADII